jgi:hypothetical protein
MILKGTALRGTSTERTYSRSKPRALSDFLIENHYSSASTCVLASSVSSTADFPSFLSSSSSGVLKDPPTTTFACVDRDARGKKLSPFMKSFKI